MNNYTCLAKEYELLKGLYFDNIDETENYVLCSSNIMDDSYWNLAYLKSEANDIVIDEIENKLINMKRTPCLYIGRDDFNYEYNKSIILNRGYKLNDTDVFMILDDYKSVDINLSIKEIENDNEYEDYMEVLSSAYNDKVESKEENVYADAVTSHYYDAIKGSINNGRTYHIIAYDNNNPVSVATLSIVNNIGIINNVGTRQGFWNRGYSKQVLNYLINLFNEKGGKELYLCTEYQSKNQLYYEKLGFKEVFVMEQYIK